MSDNKTELNQNKLLDMKSACKYLGGVSSLFLRKEMKSGAISFYEGIGKGYKFDIADLDSWIDSKRKNKKDAIDN